MSTPDHLSRLLAVERAVSPPSGTAEAELQRLLGSLAAHAAPLPVATGSLKLGSALVAKWIGVGFAVGLAGAGVASVATNGHPETRVSQAPAENRALVTPLSPPSPVADSEALRPVDSAHVAPSPAGSRRVIAGTAPAIAATAPAPAVPSAQPGLDEELRLLTAAKRELDQGRAHLARVWLDEHRQRFANGVFSLEREGLLVLAACSTAKNPQLARDFASHYPASPMLGQVMRRCGAGPSAPATPSVDDSAGGDK